MGPHGRTFATETPLGAKGASIDGGRVSWRPRMDRAQGKSALDRPGWGWSAPPRLCHPLVSRVPLETRYRSLQRQGRQGGGFGWQGWRGHHLTSCISTMPGRRAPEHGVVPVRRGQGVTPHHGTDTQAAGTEVAVVSSLYGAENYSAGCVRTGYQRAGGRSRHHLQALSLPVPASRRQ